MPRITLVFAALLIAVGVGFPLATGTTSWTAYIPASFGVVLGLFGLWGLNPNMRKHAMHFAAGFALLSAVAVVLEHFFRPGAENATNAAKAAKALSVLLLVVYVGFAVRSFIAARRARLAGTSSE